MTATQTQAKLPTLPPELDGWCWGANAGGSGLIAPDGWQTKGYQRPARAVAEAQQHVLSQSKPKPEPAPELEPAASDLLPGGSTKVAIPMIELFTQLDQHAEQFHGAIAPSTRFIVPAGLPERLSVPRDLVVPGRWQPRSRFDEDALNDLAESLKEHGVLTALKVFANEHGRLELIAGERRWRASALAGLTMVPVELCSYTLQQIAEISAIDNLQRDDLTPLEEGRFYNRMIDELQISEVALSKRLSRNRGYIQQRRAAANTAPDVQAALDAGEITFSQVRGLVAVAGDLPKVQVAALKEIRQRQKYGSAVNENGARNIAEDQVRQLVQKDLKALGWHTSSGHLWGGGERPTAMTLDQQRAVVRAQRRPTGTPPEPMALSEAQRQTLKRHGYSTLVYSTEFAPWLGGRTPGGTQFYSGDEIAPLITDLDQRWQALRDRAAAVGWQLTETYSEYWHVIGPNGRREVVHADAEAHATLDKIEAGEITDEPQPLPKTAPDPNPWSSPQAALPYQPSLSRCQLCGSTDDPTTHYRSNSGGTICDACNTQFEAEMEADRVAKRAEAQAALGTVLDQATPEALSLLAWCFVDGDAYGTDPAGWRDTILNIAANAIPHLRAQYLWPPAASTEQQRELHDPDVATFVVECEK